MKKGCKYCRKSIESFEQKDLVTLFKGAKRTGELAKLVFLKKNIDDIPEASIFYENSFVHRCKKCKTLWLSQYWEIDTPDRKYEEFGNRNWRLTVISSEDLALIKSAIKAGRKLDHDCFVDKSENI